MLSAVCDDSRQHNKAITNPWCKWWHCNVKTTATLFVITLQCSASPLRWEQPWVSSSHQPPGIFARFFCEDFAFAFQSTLTYNLFAITKLWLHLAKCCNRYSWLTFIIVKIPFWELPPIVRLEYLIGESLDRTGLRKKFWASHTGRTVEFSIGCKVVDLKSFTGWGSIPLGISHFPTTMFGQPTRTLSPYRQARSFTRLLLDSIAVSIFFDVLVELTNTVFVN